MGHFRQDLNVLLRRRFFVRQGGQLCLVPFDVVYQVHVFVFDRQQFLVLFFVGGGQCCIVVFDVLVFSIEFFDVCSIDCNGGGMFVQLRFQMSVHRLAGIQLFLQHQYATVAQMHVVDGV